MKKQKKQMSPETKLRKFLTDIIIGFMFIGGTFCALTGIGDLTTIITVVGTTNIIVLTYMRRK